MRHLTVIGCTLAAYAYVIGGATAQVLWNVPPAVSTSDWIWGPGGTAITPRPPFRFVKESLGGTNPKVDVRDAAGRTWVVKFGGEVHADTFAARMLYAVGYAAVPTTFIASGTIEDVHGLKRAKAHIRKDGRFHNARFKLHERHKQQWSWVENPFAGSRELGGLKIMVMLLSNWDAKDARDGEGSNNAIFDTSRFAVTDWGSSLGKSGGFFQRDRWNWRGYQAQTPHFAALQSDGSIQWGYRGKHGSDIVSGVSVEDVRWLLPYLSRITDEQLTAGLTASGASEGVALRFTRAIRERVRGLERIGAAQGGQEVASK